MILKLLKLIFIIFTWKISTGYSSLTHTADQLRAEIAEQALKLYAWFKYDQNMYV